VYKVKDPRATVLQELAENVFVETGRPKNYQTAVELERVAAGVLGPKGIYPNVDFYSGIVYQALGIPRDLFTSIFAISRVAGWLAHWLEQLKNNRLFRPEQIYVGKHDVAYVPLEKRPYSVPRTAEPRALRARPVSSLPAPRHPGSSPSTRPNHARRRIHPRTPRRGQGECRQPKRQGRRGPRRATRRRAQAPRTADAGAPAATERGVQAHPQGEGRGEEAGVDRRGQAA